MFFLALESFYNGRNFQRNGTEFTVDKKFKQI